MEPGLSSTPPHRSLMAFGRNKRSDCLADSRATLTKRLPPTQGTYCQTLDNPPQQPHIDGISAKRPTPARLATHVPRSAPRTHQLKKKPAVPVNTAQSKAQGRNIPQSVPILQQTSIKQARMTKKSKSKLGADPHAEREAQKYQNPIPSREFILEHLEQCEGPRTHEELCESLGLSSEDDVEALRRRLIAMERDGQLHRNRRYAYAPILKLDLVRGKVVGHKEGHGFVAPEDGSDWMFLSPREMRRVFNGDEVTARVDSADHRGRKQASIVEILSRNTTEVVGRYYRDRAWGTVVPDNPKIQHEILIPEGENLEAHTGEYVVVQITAQPERHGQPTGRVIEVLGEAMAPGLEIDVAIRSHGIPYAWPEDVEREIAHYSPTVAEEDKKGRVDIRHLPLVTIDGEDARDFDDAVYCEKKKGGGWRLIVAIADVSHYVKVGSPLDKEASERGNSVYFPGRVVPMLPEILSNELCSLKPHDDRLCMVCEMTISAQGNLSGFVFYEGVMHSHARLTYNQVAAMLGGREDLRARYRDLLPHLEQLEALYHCLRKTREARGAIDFETVETRIVFGPDKKIEEIVPTERNDAHKIIEECMLCANVATARFLQKLKLPGLYRVHEGPTLEKLQNLRAFLGEVGLNLGGGDKPAPGDYSALLAQIQDRPDRSLIQTVMLRSLSQAIYQADNLGHFGLAYTAYTHFTSPIRRYPDLLVHRAIRSVIASERETALVRRVDDTRKIPQQQIFPYDEAAMDSAGSHCSITERRADDATRDVVAWLKCEYLSDRIGEVFDGVISAVTSFGLFVELSGLYIEGLVHISALNNDYFHFDPIKHRLTGERTRVSYRLGDPIKVKLVRVDLDDRKIDLEIAQSEKVEDKSRGKTVRERLATGELKPAPAGRSPRKRRRR